MKVLLVEPNYNIKGVGKKIYSGKHIDDETLLYPPLSLMKIARFHNNRGDEVKFIRGCDDSLFSEVDFFRSSIMWDRVYISTLFTYYFSETIKTINFYKKAVGGTISKIFVGGIMASLMPKDIFEETGVYPKIGLLTSSKMIGFNEDVNIDMVTPYYDILDKNIYSVNDTYYSHTTRGCIKKCKWCGVTNIEPNYIPYIDIKPTILELRKLYGDKPKLKLMDNNVLASPKLDKIVDDLLTLGYGKDQYTDTNPPRKRVVDFNQGVDAAYIKKNNIKIISKINIKPLRIAFDRISESEIYINAVELALKNGFNEISNYMLYNFKDNPFDLYQRLIINIDLNKLYSNHKNNNNFVKIYSYPMRYAPINEEFGEKTNRKRDYFKNADSEKIDWLINPVWTKRFARNIEIMKGAARGSISPTSSLALRTIGKNRKEFLSNLYMPEIMLRNRKRYEKKVYSFEPKKTSGTGKIEGFREFIYDLLKKQNEDFHYFHNAIANCSIKETMHYLNSCKNKEIMKWLKFYLIK